MILYNDISQPQVLNNKLIVKADGRKAVLKPIYLLSEVMIVISML
jgi:hypothetical protein